MMTSQMFAAISGKGGQKADERLSKRKATIDNLGFNGHMFVRCLSQAWSPFFQIGMISSRLPACISNRSVDMPSVLEDPLRGRLRHRSTG